MASVLGAFPLHPLHCALPSLGKKISPSYAEFYPLPHPNKGSGKEGAGEDTPKGQRSLGFSSTGALNLFLPPSLKAQGHIENFLALTAGAFGLKHMHLGKTGPQVQLEILRVWPHKNLDDKRPARP